MTTIARVAVAMSCGLALVAASAPAQADDTAPAPPLDYFATSQRPPGEIGYRVTPERTRQQRLLIGGLIAGAGLATAVGLYFHLDSRSAANAVSADSPTNRPWTSDRQAEVDRAGTSRTGAVVCYGLAGGLAVAALVVLWRTQPVERIESVKAASPTIMPTNGGAVVGAQWGF